MSRDELTLKMRKFLPGIPDEDIQLFASICEYRKYEDKQVILKSGNRWKKAFLVLEGAARGFLWSDEGLEQTILLRGKGILVGDPQSLFSDMPQQMEISSVGLTEVLLFSFGEFENLALRNKSIQHIYMNGLKEAILRLMYRVRGMVTMSSEERYLDLLRMNPAFLEKSYDKYVASYLGITPVSLSRIKKRVKKSELSKDNFVKE